MTVYIQDMEDTRGGQGAGSGGNSVSDDLHWEMAGNRCKGSTVAADF